ncbi:hypothetical protein EV2_007254 [Malus domestica]
MNSTLCSPFSIENREAAFQLGALKAPGLDGLPGLFYHKFWETINDTIVDTATEFHEGGMMLQQLNQTHITLIPKVPNPESTS